MPKFFVPTSWENLAEAIKFRSKGSIGDNVHATKITNDKAQTTKPSKTNVKKKKGKKNAASVGALAGIASKGKTTKSINKVTDSAKVRSGRVTKKKVTKKSKKKELKKAASAPAAVAAADVPTVDSKTKQPEKKLEIKKSNSATKVSSAASMLENMMSDAESDDAASRAGDDPEEDIGLRVFASSLKEQLMGGRFRFINEQLYTTDSTGAEELFKNDADAFEAYHAGYQQQVEKWPLNPLDRIIKLIRRLPKSMVIADFGCGEGRLAASLPNKVYSMDLVSTRNDIIACDMANTPLAEQSVDIVVYCLSLMGTNLKDYILEANRVLRLYGLVLIAEIQSRFEDLRQFLHGLKACGFEVVRKDVSEELFYFFQLKKVRNVGKVALIPPFSLKPCLYRKRGAELEL